MKATLLFGREKPSLEIESKGTVLHVVSASTVRVTAGNPPLDVMLSITHAGGTTFIVEANPWPSSAQISVDGRRATGGSGNRGSFDREAQISFGGGASVDLAVIEKRQ